MKKEFNYGWICPKCGAVYSPLTTMCFKCTNEKNNTTSTSSVSIDGNDLLKNFKNSFKDEIKIIYNGCK